MFVQFTWEVKLGFKELVETIHDYVWAGEEEDE